LVWPPQLATSLCGPRMPKLPQTGEEAGDGAVRTHYDGFLDTFCVSFCINNSP